MVLEFEEEEAEETEEDDSTGSDALEVTPSEAARFLGMSRPALLKLLDRGAIKYRKEGNHRFIRMKHLKELKASGAFSTKDENTDMYDAHTQLTQTALQHVKDIFKPVTEAWKQAADMYQNVINSLTARNEKLEETHLDMLKQREQFLTQTHERMLLSQESEARQRRVDDIFNTVKAAAPDLLAQLAETLGGAKRATMATLVAKLAASGKLQALLDSPMFLDEEEQRLLREALKDFLPKEPIETEGESADTSDPQQSQSPPNP